MATRFYLANGAAHDPGIVIAPDAGWTQQDAVVEIRNMYTTPITNALTNIAYASSAAGNHRLCRQYLSAPLAAGNVFSSVAALGKMQIQGFESAINDNITARIRGVFVVSEDGQTRRATLKAKSDAGSSVEWNATLRNLSFMTTEIIDNDYTTVTGDRLLLEIGYRDTGGASISGTLRWGADSTATDLGQNETDTGTTLRPWFETTLTLNFKKNAPPMPTRQKRMYHHLTR